MKGSIEWLPQNNEMSAWEEANRLVTVDVMADARSIYKIETGKACNNNAMRMCLQRAIYELLIKDKNVRNIFKE